MYTFEQILFFFSLTIYWKFHFSRKCLSCTSKYIFCIITFTTWKDYNTSIILLYTLGVLPILHSTLHATLPSALLFKTIFQSTSCARIQSVFPSFFFLIVDTMLRNDTTNDSSFKESHKKVILFCASRSLMLHRFYVN